MIFIAGWRASVSAGIDFVPVRLRFPHWPQSHYQRLPVHPHLPRRAHAQAEAAATSISRLNPRHGHRRGDQDRQSGANRRGLCMSCITIDDAYEVRLRLEAQGRQGICRVISVLSRSQFGSTPKTQVPSESEIRMRRSRSSYHADRSLLSHVGLSFSSSSSFRAMTRVVRM